MTRNTIFMATWSPNRKIDCGNKIWKKTCLFTFSKGNLKMTASCLASFVNFVKVSKQQWNGSALLLYAIVISVQKLIQVTKSNTAGFLRIQRHNRKILKKILAKIKWNKLEWRTYLLRILVKKKFLIGNKDPQNIIAPYSQILKMEIKTWKHS